LKDTNDCVYTVLNFALFYSSNEAFKVFPVFQQ